jgi:isopenicillin N synthase-like dioxygenase
MIVPVIDLTAETAAHDVRRASRDRGLFYVVNRGVAASLIAAQFDLARSFFALDRAEKCEIDVRNADCFRGYEPFGSQTIDAAAPGDRKEGFIMGPDLPPDHPHVLARYPNTGANRWPRRPAGFRQRMETYVAAMNGLGRRVAAVLARSLDLPSDFLLQDDVGGLEVRDGDGTWCDVAPVPGAFLIVLGELMVRLTGGRYRSATHRVTANTSGRSCYSIATFFDPGYDERIACAPTCVPPLGAPRDPGCTVAEHMREMERRHGVRANPITGTRRSPGVHPTTQEVNER